MKHTKTFSSGGLRPAGRVLWAGVLALGLAGCSLLPKSEPLVRYELPAGEVQPMASTPLPFVLVVPTPLANQALSTDRILVVPQGNELSAYKGVRWDDLAPALLRSRLMQAFRESNLVQLVIPGATGLRPDVGLGSDLSAFQVRIVDGAPVVQLRVDMALVRSDTGRPLGVQRFSINQPVDGKEVPQVVQAYGKAVQQLNQQVLDWAAPLLKSYAATRDQQAPANRK